jgi:hypothetical protein
MVPASFFTALFDNYNVVMVDGGESHALALLSNGSVVAWTKRRLGANKYGQATVPPFPAGRTAVQVAAGANFSVVLLDNGSLLVWGDNSFGQATVPQYLEGVKVTAVAAGHFQSWQSWKMALLRDLVAMHLAHSTSRKGCWRWGPMPCRWQEGLITLWLELLMGECSHGAMTDQDKLPFHPLCKPVVCCTLQQVQSRALRCWRGLTGATQLAISWWFGAEIVARAQRRTCQGLLILLVPGGTSSPCRTLVLSAFLGRQATTYK